MSEKKKKIIYVKDLVIKADHVTIEPQKRRHPVDPFFGPKREEVEAVKEKHEKYDEVKAVEDEKDDYKDNDEGEKRPFSWI